MDDVASKIVCILKKNMKDPAEDQFLWTPSSAILRSSCLILR